MWKEADKNWFLGISLFLFLFEGKEAIPFVVGLFIFICFKSLG